MLAVRLARRELRSGLHGLRIVLACLALGVTVIVGVGTLRAAIERGLAEDGRQILGGDLEIDGGAQPLPTALRDWLRARGARVSQLVQMRSLLVGPGGERQLVALRAVDPAWPLVGKVRLDPAQSAQQALADRGLIAERVVLDRLGLKPGQTVRLGEAQFTVRATLVSEPDRAASPALAPHAIIGLETLPATGLIAPGSMVDHALRAVFPDGTKIAALIHELQAAFPAQGWRIRTQADAAPGVKRVVERLGAFLTLAGLTALLVGGIGMATGVGSWLAARARSIATLRCLGASAALVFGTYLIQIVALSLASIVAGAAIGTALPAAAVALIGDRMPVPARFGLFPGPLLLGITYGLLTACAFAMWPLARASRIPGAALFRDAVVPERTRPSGPALIAGLGLGGALIALAVMSSPDRRFALWFCAASVAALAVFRAGATLLMLAATRARLLGWPSARLGVANLHRPGCATPLIMVSVGIGLSVLTSVALIETNLRQEIAARLPADAPSFFFIDLQDEQLPRFEAIAREAGAFDIQHAPNLRARVVAVNGVPASEVRATPETKWGLAGDRGLTYSATRPEGIRLIAGSWWPPDYTGPPLLSFDAELAKGWGIGIGDTIRVNVLGRNLDLRVANLRDIEWRSFGINYTMITSAGLLAHAPHTNIATVRAAPERQGLLLRAVTDALPNVTGIPVAEVLRTVADILGRIGTALMATGSLTLLAGALVLAVAVAAGQRRRMQEAAILKALGASRGQIQAAWLVEFGVLGLAAGLLACLVGTAASWGAVRYWMRADWSFLPGRLAVTVIASMAFMLAFGYLAAATALRGRVAGLLRNE